MLRIWLALLSDHGLESADLVCRDDVELLQIIDAVVYEAIDLSRFAVYDEMVFAVRA